VNTILHHRLHLETNEEGENQCTDGISNLCLRIEIDNGSCDTDTN
jgi:hypothetical protein